MHLRCPAAAVLLVAAVACTAAGDASAADASGRSYELVSPAKKFYGVGQGDVIGLTSAVADGDAVFYSSLMSLPGSPDGEGNEEYRARRSASGWSSEPLVPATQLQSPSFGNDQFGPFQGSSGDGQTTLFSMTRSLDPGDQDYDASNGLNAQDLYVRRPDGTFSWASPGPVNSQPFYINDILWGSLSADGSHVAFQSTPPLLSADNGRTSGTGVYDWHDGVLDLVGVGNDGALLSPDSVSLGAPDSGAPSNIGRNAISADGSHIFFTVDGRVYVRINEQLTRSIAPGSAPTATQTFLGATPDGSKAFFWTSEALVPDDTGTTPDVYEYDVASNSVTRISAPAPGVSVANGDVGLYVTGIAFSQDARRVYFSATAGLVAGAPANGIQLYVWDNGALRLVAGGLVDSPFTARGPGGCGVSGSQAWSTPDGAHLVFRTRTALTADDHDTNRDLYEYSAGNGALVRVSGDGDRGNEAVDVESSLTLGTCETPTGIEPRVVSDDGRYVFFQTTEGLVPTDINAQLDVYQHDLVTGLTSLVSSGTGSRPSRYLDSGASGRDVFFATFDALVPQDDDTRFDVYDARIGGGFPVNEPAPACNEDDCQGTAVGALHDAVSPGSARVTGSGPHDAVAPNRPALTLERISRAQLREMARTGRLTVRVRSSVAGTVSVSLRAETHRHPILVGARSTKVASQAPISIKLALSSWARRELVRHRHLSLSLRAVLNPGNVARHAQLHLVRLRSVHNR